MENIYITLKYKTSSWDFADAEDHANELANDVSGTIEDTIEDDTYEEAHLFTLLVVDDDPDSLRSGIYEILSGLGGVQFTIESDDDEDDN